jgi:hypothetical protein
MYTFCTHVVSCTSCRSYMWGLSSTSLLRLCVLFKLTDCADVDSELVMSNTIELNDVLNTDQFQVQ